MITKGYITALPVTGDNRYKVRLPIFEQAGITKNKKTNSEFLATVSTEPSNINSYNVGDCVYVGFEDNNYSYPVILGLLDTGKERKSSTYSLVNALRVTETANLPSNTNIGDVNFSELILELNQLKNKEDKLPTPVVDKYLHVKQDGELEWADATGQGTGKVDSVSVNGGTPFQPDSDKNVDLIINTSDLTNDGEDGSSPFATQAWVETHGGKIQSITVNDITYAPESGSTNIDIGDYVTESGMESYVQNYHDNTKVDKETGKGLSTNDYTTADKNKLAGIESGAEVNVQADWNITDANSDAYIKNKPSIPAAQVNSDWNASSGVAQILNKPDLATVATTGSYNDLINKPTIPTVNDGTLTITKNTSTTLGTFTANQSGNTTANIAFATNELIVAESGSEYIDLVGVRDPDWGNIQGDIENQLDLVQYISEAIEEDGGKVDSISFQGESGSYTPTTGTKTIVLPAYPEDTSSRVSALESDVDALESGLATVESYIDNGTSSSNKLVNETTMNQAIAASAANLVTSNQAGDSFSSHAALEAGPYYSNGSSYTPAKNDYAIVAVDEDHDNNQTRYKCTSASPLMWSFEYVIGSTQVQANWNQTDITSPSYIQNKPTVGNATITIHQEGVSTDQTFDLDDTSNTTVNLKNTTYTLSSGTTANVIKLTPSTGSEQTVTVNNVAHATSADSATSATSATTAANATKLDNKNASYYLDYTNFTNKPSIPVTPSDLIIDESGSEYIDLVGYPEDSNTWRPVKVNGTQKLDNSPEGASLDLVAGSNITLSESGGAITINSTASGNITDVKIGNNSIVESGGIAQIVTESTYNASSNKIATMSDVTGQGYITGIDSSDVITALGYTPYSASNPNGYTSNIGTVTSVNNVSPVSGNVSLTIPTLSNSGNGSITDGTTTFTFGSNAFNSTTIPTVYLTSASKSGNTLTINAASGATVTYTPTFVDTNTWRAIKVNGVQKLDNSIEGNPLDLVAGTNITLSESNGAVTISSTGGISSVKTLDTTNTTSQSTSASEAITGTGSIKLHRISKTGKMSDTIIPESGSEYVDLIGTIDGNYVRYDTSSQGLSSQEQANARTNIGAGVSNFTGYTSSNKLSTDYINNVAGWTSNSGTVTSVRVQAGTGLSSSTSTAQSSTLDTTISVASGYKLPTTSEWANKQDALPTVINDRYLHTNASTGALEWASVSGGSASIVSITYSELKSLRDNSQLIPGQLYRITDYVTIVSSYLVSAASNYFDILIRADSSNILNEEALATNHSGDSYFSNSKLNAWRLRYCIDNDTTRFNWAHSSGKGVIYYMKDEFGNEAPYDFKNIKFGGTKNDGNDYGYTYTFNVLISNVNYDASVPSSTPYMSGSKVCCGNIITSYYSNNIMNLPWICFYSTSTSSYYWRNNLLKSARGTLCTTNTLEDTIVINSSNNIVNRSYNYIEGGSYNKIYGSQNVLINSSNCTIGTDSNSNYFRNCSVVYIGEYCDKNEFTDCYCLIFGPSESSIQDDCCRNKFTAVEWIAFVPETGSSFTNVVVHRGLLDDGSHSEYTAVLIPEGNLLYETNVYPYNSQTVYLDEVERD